MTRSERVELSVVKAIEAGYEFLGKGMGRQDEALNSKRAEGYDVKAWYTVMNGDESNWQWLMYGKKKVGRGRKVVAPKKMDYYQLTVKDLKKLCSEKKIKGYAKMKKEQMIETLQAAM